MNPYGFLDISSDGVPDKPRPVLSHAPRVVEVDLTYRLRPTRAEYRRMSDDEIVEGIRQEITRCFDIFRFELLDNFTLNSLKIAVERLMQQYRQEGMVAEYGVETFRDEPVRYHNIAIRFNLTRNRQLRHSIYITIPA